MQSRVLLFAIWLLVFLDMQITMCNEDSSCCTLSMETPFNLEIPFDHAVAVYFSGFIPEFNHGW